MDRRLFFKTIIGGVATAAAVRTWPFRSYFFPSDLRRLPMDLGFNMFDYAGLPMIEDFELDGGMIYVLNQKLIVPNPKSWCRLTNLEVPKSLDNGKGITIL